MMSASELFSCPDPLSLLFAWRQGGDEEGPRTLVQSKIMSDGGLIEMLEHLTSQIMSSRQGKIDTLKKENISPFVNYETIVQRIRALKSHKDLGARATRLAAALDGGAEHEIPDV